MIATAPLRVAVAGAGYFSRFHLDSWSRTGRTQVVAVADRDPARAAVSGVPGFAEVGQMLAAAPADILDIVLPPQAHGAAIRAAMAAGVPTVICQKPFCTDLAEAKSLVAEAAAAGTTLIVHENFRFQPWYRAMRTTIAAGDLGQVQQASFRLRPGDGQGPRAYLDRQPYFRDLPRFLIRETGVHWVDTFRFLLGDPTAVYADLRRLNPAIAGEDAGIVVFEHAEGVRAVFDGNRHLDHAADNLRRTMGEAWIEGTAGALTLTGDGSVHLRRFGDATRRQILGPDTWEGFGGDCVHRLQCHVVAGILDGSPIENLAADYLTVIRIEEAIYASAAQGRRIVLEDA